MSTNTTYKELLEQRAALELQIQLARKAELTGAIEQVRVLVSEFGLTQSDVFPASKQTKAGSGAKVEPKYRNPATGQTWTGRGKPPVWIRDLENKDQFKI